jgi:hypothetical protein
MENTLRGEALNEWFKQKLASGRWGEIMILNHLISKGWTILEISDHSYWDIKATKNNQIKTFEVKTNYYEYKMFRHNMVVIETESNGVLSGLSVTTADFYILYYPFENMFYVEEVSQLKNMIKNGMYKKVKGGRKDLATMYQIPRDHFIHKKELKFMDYLDENTKQQEWWDWYVYKYINKVFDLL